MITYKDILYSTNLVTDIKNLILKNGKIQAADGHTMTDFIQVIVDIYKTSGLIKTEGTEEEKNV